MKLKHQAVRSLTTHQLKELADIAYIQGLQRASQSNRQQNNGNGSKRTEPSSQNGRVGVRSAESRSESRHRSTGSSENKALSATPIWELKERAETLREKEQLRRESDGPKNNVRRRQKNFFERFVQRLLGKPRAPEQTTGDTGYTVDGLVTVTKQPFPDADQAIHKAAKCTLNQMIVGGVGLNDVLKELERRGVSYKPPIDKDGVLNIDQSDLIPGRLGEHARLRPGISKYVKDHQDNIAGIRVNTTHPVDLGSIDMPHGFIESTGPIRANYLTVKELHTVGDVTVEDFISAEEIQAKGNINARNIMTSECTVYGNINCSDTLKFTSGSTDSRQVLTGNVQCGHITSEDDRDVEVIGDLLVKGNCRVPRLSANELTVGWELQNTKELSVSGKANIAKLSRTIEADAEFRGEALQEYIDQLKDVRKEDREEAVIAKINKAKDMTGKDGAVSIEWAPEDLETDAYKAYVLNENSETESEKRETTARERPRKQRSKVAV